MAFTPISGTAGRLKLGSAIIAGISSWRRSSKTNVIPIPHFESGANADGLVQPNKLRGLGDGGTVAIEGLVDLDPTTGTHAVIENGKYLTADLVADKTGAKGYDGVVGWVSDFQLGVKVSNEAASFSMTLEVDGVFPTWGTIS